MNEMLQLLGQLAIVFALCVGASYALTAIVQRRRKALAPAPNTVIRFKTGGAMYRSRFLGSSEEGWLLSPPLQRDHYVPIREGEEIKGEIVTPAGIRVFRTTVLRRETSPPRFVVKPPATMTLRERRDDPRRENLAGMRADLDGDAAVLIDLSEHGAKVASPTCPERGERVALRLPWLEQPQFAYVLESAPPADTERTGCDVRLRFEEPLTSQPS